MYSLKFYTAKDGLYFSTHDRATYFYGSLQFNGKTPKKTWSNCWFFLEGETEIKSVTQEISKSGGLVGYELKDPSIATDKIPLKLTLEDVGFDYDEDGDEYWSHYESVRPLYKATLSEPTVETKEHEFTVEHLGEINILGNSIEDMQVGVIEKVGFKTETNPEMLSNLASYSDVEEMLVSPLLIHKRPCKLEEEVMYKIVRNHIRQNINTAYARVTSDYDFCFSVSKKVAIKPYEKRWETKKSNGKSYAKPRFNYKTIDHKEVLIFEMAPKPYNKYPVIEGIYGENLKDLADNLNNYLTELMDVINIPLTECEHCDGFGHNIIKIPTNKENT